MKHALLAALLASTSAYAQPTYLVCETLSPNGSPATVTLTLDENASTVVFTDTSTNKDKLRRVQAQYSATAVLFNYVVLPGVSTMRMNYELNRVDGTLTYWITQDKPSTGPCIKPAVERKF